jgi:hypothetical protein
VRKEIKIGILFYAIADYLSAIIGWMLFLFYRKSTYQYISFTEFISSEESMM